MSNKKLTALEWFIDQMKQKNKEGEYIFDTKDSINNLINQAKELEKQQIENSFNEGRTMTDKINTICEVWLATSETLEERDEQIKKIPQNGNQYYNNTYGE